MTKQLFRIMAITTLITLAATAAQAARQWKHIGSDDKNTHFLYDKKTTKRQGDVVSGWISKQYNVDVKAMKEKKLPLNQYHGKNWTLAFYDFDCKQNTMRARTGRENLTGKKAQDIIEEDYRAVVPKSGDEVLLKAICKEVK